MDKFIAFLQSLSRIEPKLLKIPLVAITLIATALALLLSGGGAAAIVLLTCVAAVVFLRFEDITEFDLSVFKGLRTKLERSITEANATTSQLRQLGLTLSAPIVAEVALSGQFLKYETFASRQLKINKIAINLREMGVSEAEVIDVLGPWRVMACHELFGKIYEYLDQQRSENAALLMKMRADDLVEKQDDVKTFLRALPKDDPTLTRLTAAYMRVCDNGQLDDPQVYDLKVEKLRALEKPDRETIGSG